MFDLIIKNGRIIDGTGSPWYEADIGLKGEKIVKIGYLAGTDAHRIIDAEKRFICPGFVDIHSHTDLLCTIPKEQKRDYFIGRITQGITTEINGNCGVGVATVTDSSRSLIRGICSFFSPEHVDWQWSSFESYLDNLGNVGQIANVGTLISHGEIRVAAMGVKSEIPERAEMRQMKRLVREAMEHGAFGMSTGLIYPPGMFSHTKELAELAKEVAKYGGIYTSHIRASSDISIPSVQELLEVGWKADVHVHHSHHGAAGKDNWWKLDKTIAMEEQARENGLPVTFDVIPYNFATTGMVVLFPPWAMEGGVNNLIQNLRNETARENIRWEIENTIPGWPPWIKGRWGQNYVRDVGWDNLQIASVASEKNKDCEGLNLMEYAELKNKSPFDAAADLMITEQGKVTVFIHAISGDIHNENPLEKLLTHPMSAIITDAYDLGRGKPHPAAYGAFPRVLNHFVKEKKILRLEEAIRKMTSYPAQIIGIFNRGIIRESMMADLLIIDMENIQDNATFEHPRKLSQGIDYVIINGMTVVEDGNLHDIFPGKVLRKV